jgi:hypothetical protein
MPVLETLGETGVKPHVVCFGVSLLKGVCRWRFRRNTKVRGERNNLRGRWSLDNRHYMYRCMNNPYLSHKLAA